MICLATPAAWEASGESARAAWVSLVPKRREPSLWKLGFQESRAEVKTSGYGGFAPNPTYKSRLLFHSKFALALVPAPEWAGTPYGG
uniref:Uncharacterized protein n=1 Tax=Candidatus Kentrum sp. UNK TaxID=2126344 RepID=A0A451ALD6_9GAMM|nr:MAG: hypothetical protein BECKUNK1418G_GA0071005_11115 [Candidatus Kentron sp. UNK]VFK72241.1 MAG: hypothetical protein BECKUNK1418H_GA0071006_11035 [Candidatus Kentron sp. UNK]